MESTYKQISSFGKSIFFTVTSVGKVLINTKFGSTLPIQKNNKCVVIANGPSFKKDYEINREYYIKNDCIVTNMFALSDIFFEVKPKHYVWLDSLMWSGEDLNALQTVNVLNEKVNWPINIFIPYFAKCESVINELSKNINIKIIRYNYVYFKGFNNVGNYFYKKQWMCPRMLSVTSMALFIALNMKYNKIFLSGADQNWHQRIIVDENNVVCTALDHFYDGEKKVSYQPFYKSGKKELGTNSISDFFWIALKTFEGFNQVAGYAKYLNAKIYNVSKESFIDVFEKKDLNQMENL